MRRFSEARKAGTQALEHAREQSDLRMEGYAEWYLSIGAWMERRFDQAETHARNAVKVLEDVLPALPAAFAALGQALLGQGKTEEALTSAREAYRLLNVVAPVEQGDALIRVVCAECLFAAGEAADAVTVIHEAAQRLRERAAAIDDAASRTAFLSRIPVHARTLEMALLIAPADGV